MMVIGFLAFVLPFAVIMAFFWEVWPLGLLIYAFYFCIVCDVISRNSTVRMMKNE